MKRTFNLASISFVFCMAGIMNSSAQNSISIGTTPLGFLSKATGTIEFETNSAWTVGSTISYNYGTVWVGTKGEFNLRYYFAKTMDSTSSDGFYATIKPGIASFKTPYSVKSSEFEDNPFFSPWVNQLLNSIDGFGYLDRERTLAGGIGVGLGYKKSIKRFSLDFNCRFQKWQTEKKPIIQKQNGSETVTFTPYDGNDRLNFSLYGPGSIIAPTLILGYHIR